MDISGAKRFKHPEDENRRLKQMVADVSLDQQALEYASAEVKITDRITSRCPCRA